MKKLVTWAALVCVLVVFCVPASATVFTVSGTDLTIHIDDSIWYVFTRDNIRNNPEMEELGLTYEFMNTTMQENSIYLDAVLYFEDGEYMELLVIKTKTDSSKRMANLSMQSASEVDDFAEGVRDSDVDSCEIYKNQYTYLEVTDTDADLYLYNFLTVVNGEIYTLKFQSSFCYTQDEIDYMREMVDTVTFDVDPSKVPEEEGFLETVAGRALIGAAVGGCVGGLVGVLGKKKAKKKQEDSWPQQPVQ